ncbi:MAG: 4-(cytidine 5'-diphospho)-2-C-methyl-D-erythritol kinase [Chloroflexota bacterium]|nr:4-(cytidine 5'-diphospho)-2-C-methyl-D-erythritol kinase [Chloroflexota bacterium]
MRRETRAYAKINLSLQVLGKRADGFHDLVSIMQTVSLCDDLTFAPAEEVTFSCSQPELTGPSNLVVRAANLLRQVCGVSAGCSIHLEKHIPHAAGLGGGSSDAAATLRSLVKLWALTEPKDTLCRLAAQLGSDVPFFLQQGTALVEGRGERVTPLPDPPTCWYLLAKPPVQVPTAEIFARLQRAAWSDGSRTHALASHLRQGGRVHFGPNSLQDALFSAYPLAQDCFERVSQVSEGRATVSGSGPTIVAWFSSQNEARRAAARLEDNHLALFVTSSVPSRGRKPSCA